MTFLARPPSENLLYPLLARPLERLPTSATLPLQDSLASPLLLERFPTHVTLLLPLAALASLTCLLLQRRSPIRVTPPPLASLVLEHVSIRLSSPLLAHLPMSGFPASLVHSPMIDLSLVQTHLHWKTLLEHPPTNVRHLTAALGLVLALAWMLE